MGGTWELLGRNMGVTWEERFRFTFVSSLLSNRVKTKSYFFLFSSFVNFSHCSRFTFVTSLLSNRCQSEGKAKFYRISIEDLSKIYRRPIEDLSKTYRRRGEEGAEWAQRGSREGAVEEFGYKVTKFLSHIFTFLVVSVT